MTTDSGSSLSQAEVHENVALSIVESDAELLCESFNSSVARWLTDWNFPGAAYPRVRRNLDGEADLKALADRDKVLSDMGFAPNLEYVIETYGEGFKQDATEASPVTLNGAQLQSFVSLITTAQQAGWSKEMARTSLEIAFPHVSDALLDRMAESIEVEAQPAAGEAVEGAENLDDVARMFAAFSAPDDPIADLIPQLADIGDATFKSWFTDLRSLMTDSDNLVDFERRLADAYPNLSADDFKQAMVDASTVAGMQGYSDAASLDDASFARIPEGTIRGDKVLRDSRWRNIDEMPPPPPRPQQPLVAKPMQPRRLKPEAFSDSDRDDFEAMMRDSKEIQSWGRDVEKAFGGGLDSSITSRILDGYTFAKNAPSKYYRSVKAEGRIQAAAKVKDEGSELHIADLGSAPWNNGLNDERSIRGAGKAMIASVIQESIDKGYEGKVSLEDTDDSRPFYDAIGFEYGNKYKGHRYLTPEAAAKFMSAYRGSSASFARGDYDWMDYIDLLEIVGGCNISDSDPEDLGVEFKMKEGTTRINPRTGKTEVLRNSRWRIDRSSEQVKPPKTPKTPKAKADPATKKRSSKSKQATDAIVADLVPEQTEQPAKKPRKKKEKSAEPESAEQGDPVKTNQKNLDAARAEIVKQSSEEAVAKAEAAAKAILDSPDTGVFVRVGNNSTLAAILGDRFKNSVELGGDADVPGLTESYQDARKRVEREQMGYADDSDPTTRPIYAYLGNAKDLNSESHEDVSAFGGITIKLKDEIKQRATFTGADSFKSGVASRVGDPSAASLIQNSRHGKPSDLEGVSEQIAALGKAKNIDEMMSAVSGDGNRYVETQVHGQVKPGDIGEIHFTGRGEPPTPSKEVRDWAKENGVKIFKDGEPYEHREISETRRKEIAEQLTPELFADFVNASVRRADQVNPKGSHNLKYEDWKAQRAKEISRDRRWTYTSDRDRQKEIDYRSRKEFYAKELESAIGRGLYVDDAMIDSIPEKGSGSPVSKKVREKMKADSAAAKSKQASESQLHKDMLAILDAPLVSDADRAKHKPMMSEKEAADYASDSAFGDHTFYHGSQSQAAVKSITEQGVNISANTTGLFGGGFYMGAGSDVANVYSNDEGDVISFKVKMKNPYVVKDTTSELNQELTEAGLSRGDMGDLFGNRFGDSSFAGIPAYLRLKGHDGVYMVKDGYTIGFEREQMVAFSKQKGKIPRDADGYAILGDDNKPEVKALGEKLLKNAKNN
jgi:hypothetical protein